jgi:hypothetical protein
MNKVGKRALAAAYFWIASACSGPASQQQPPPTPPPASGSFTNGTRLKAVYQRIDGAPPVFLRWYDTQLDIDCTFIDVGLPDRLVCYPIDATGDGVDRLFASVTNSLFADSGCALPIVNAPSAPCQARFAALWPAPGAACAAPRHLYKVGPAVPLDPGGLYVISSDGGTCHPAAASDLGTYKELHTLGPEVPLDTLVGGTYQHDAGAGRIVALRIAGSDGSIQGEAKTNATAWAAGGAAAWDSEHGERVSTTLRPGGHWLPAVPYNINALFSDAACSLPIALGPACPIAAREAFAGATDECGFPAPTRFYELGAPIADQSRAYAVSSTTRSCQAYGAGTGAPIAAPPQALFSLGAPVPVSAFADATETHAGSGPIQIIQAGSAGGPPVASVGFFDSVHGTPCTFQPIIQAADGVVRCLPPAADAPYFADAGCSVPLFVSSPAPASCATGPAFASLTETVPAAGGGCSMPLFRRHIYPAGDLYKGEIYERVGPEDCFDIGTEVPSGDAAYATGAEIPARDFAPLDYVRPN